MPVIHLPLEDSAARIVEQIPTSAYSAFVFTLRGAHATHYAAAAWVVYDWLLTLDDEVRLIWGSPYTPPTLLYLFSRYGGLFTQIMFACSSLFPWYCFNRLVFSSVMLGLLQLSIEFSLMIRVYALWGRKARVAICLLTLFVANEISSIVMTVKAGIIIAQGILPLPPSWTVDGCIGSGPPAWFHFCWIPSLVYETAIFVVSCIKCLSYRPFSRAPLAVKMFLDGAIFYVVVLGFVVWTMVIGYFSYVALYSEVFAAAVFSLSCSHLLLSIRDYAANQSHIHGSVNVEDSDRTAHEDKLNCQFAHRQDTMATKFTIVSNQTTVQGEEGEVIDSLSFRSCHENELLDFPELSSSDALGRPSATVGPLANSPPTPGGYGTRVRDWIVAE